MRGYPKSFGFLLLALLVLAQRALAPEHGLVEHFRLSTTHGDQRFFLHIEAFHPILLVDLGALQGLDHLVLLLAHLVDQIRLWGLTNVLTI